MPTIKTQKGVLKLPVMTPILVPAELIQANNYNPNHVDDNNMKLLERSFILSGFAFAIVTVWDPDIQKFVIVDGFHRDDMLETWFQCEQIPIIVLDLTPAQRMEATVQFNRARGMHQVDLMGDLVKALLEQGQDDEEIAKQLGMEMEEVFRLKQITGIAEIFKNQTYSRAWEMQDVDIDG
ncbi:ParB N-terminal domain-containing protein [Clostridium sp. 19966]|nr:ParB N-terminal domain-containing protein [Clostridium sp. 19966]